MHFKASSIFSTCLLTLCFGSPVAAEDFPQIVGVDLGQSGLALYTLTYDAEGKDSISLPVPAEHSNDLLGTLVVRDPSGGVIGLSTDTPSTASELMRSTSFQNTLPSSAATLLNGMKGSRVRIETQRESVEGIVLGVDTTTEVVGETTIEYPLALLIDQIGEGSVVSEVVLVPGTRIKITPEDGLLLFQAAESLDSRQPHRTFDLDLEATEPRKVKMSYVAEAPAWKNSWRLMLDTGRLQGWATFENTSGRHWSNVSVTLSTGTPVAYRRALLDPLRIERLDPPGLVKQQTQVRPDQGYTAEMAEIKSAKLIPQVYKRLSPAIKLSSMSATPISGPAQAVSQIKGIGNVRYTLPNPVDLATGRTTNRLYIDMPVETEVQALYQPGQSKDALLAVRLTAEQPLAPGLVSVRDANGFVGDAPFTGLSAGQTRFLPYAAASGVIITEDQSRSGYNVDIKATQGSLSAEIRSQIKTVYRASLPNGVDVFAVEHPKHRARFIKATGKSEENANFIRISQPVKDGKVAIEVIEEDIQFKRVSADRNGYRQIISLTAVGIAEIDAEDRALLDKASELTLFIKNARERYDDTVARYNGLQTEQKRLRDNMRVVRSNGLQRRYEGRMGETEDEIGALIVLRNAAQAEVREGERALDEVIGQFR